MERPPKIDGVLAGVIGIDGEASVRTYALPSGGSNDPSEPATIRKASGVLPLRPASRHVSSILPHPTFRAICHRLANSRILHSNVGPMVPPCRQEPTWTPRLLAQLPRISRECSGTYTTWQRLPSQRIVPFSNRSILSHLKSYQCRWIATPDASHRRPGIHFPFLRHHPLQPGRLSDRGCQFHCVLPDFVPVAKLRSLWTLSTGSCHQGCPRT